MKIMKLSHTKLTFLHLIQTILTGAEAQACRNVPCQNQAYCIPDSYNSNGFKCVCQQSFTGVYCGQVVNPCDSGPCVNGGICQMQISQNAFQASFTCNCQSRYSGRNCEVLPQNFAGSIAPAQYYPQSPYQQAQQSVYGNNAGGYYGMPPQYSTQTTNSYGIPQYSPGMFSGPIYLHLFEQ